MSAYVCTCGRKEKQKEKERAPGLEVVPSDRPWPVCTNSRHGEASDALCVDEAAL